MASENRIEQWLRAHPDGGGGPLESIRCAVERRSEGALFLRYDLAGNIAAMIVPEPAEPLRTGNLWETSCVELYLKPEGSSAYREFNFSPSTQWAAWQLSAYRQGLAEAPVTAPPAIAVKRESGLLRIDVELAVDLPEGPCDLALSAVIEGRGGAKAYWALNHAAGAPDFHHPACFAAKLPPAPKA